MNNRTFTQDLLGVQNDLLRFAYKLTSDREEANDLLQETSLKALDNEEKYTPDTNFKGWIYTIMRNIFINNYRKVVRDQTFVDTTDNLYHLNTLWCLLLAFVRSQPRFWHRAQPCTGRGLQQLRVWLGHFFCSFLPFIPPSFP